MPTTIPALCILLSAAGLLALASGAAADAARLPVSPGETSLSDVGSYEVFYQSYGGPVVAMPLSWTGHFEQTSGISYLPGEQVLGRLAILLHSPWRVPPGKAWVDYPIALPDLTPARLRFGIAMRPDMAVPGKSDGVTFSAFIIDSEGEHELLRVHHDRGEWADHDIDLSEWAGKSITLRLQTEPGPAGSPSFDYSYFGGAAILVGNVTRGRRERLESLLSSRAHRVTKDVSLAKLANAADRGVVPSNLLAHVNQARAVGRGYELAYRGDDCEIVYTYLPKTGTLDDWVVSVDGGRPFRPAGGGAASFTTEAGDARLIAATLREDDRAVDAVWEYRVADRPARINWRFGIDGKALTVRASCDAPAVSGFSLGHVTGALLRRTVHIPYLPADWGRGCADYLPADNLFVCRYLDWTQSHSSRCPQGNSIYAPKTDGALNPLYEVGYVAVSPNVNEVLPNIPWEPSSYLSLLGPRIMLDIWSHHKGTYAGDAENLRDLKDNGVDHLAIISHVWQRYGYDVKLPDHLPANPQFGGDEGMIRFGRAANECGYVWSLHENYIDLYPDAPSYDPAARVLTTDGAPSKAWFNAGTGVQSFGLKCNRALEYAKQNAPEVHRRFKTTAAYLDVHTCVPPWHQLDHEADQPMAAMAHAKVLRDAELFDYMRQTHEGPLFGEGANHAYWAGKCDGTEAQVAGGEHHVPLLDFDLLKLHPQMVNHGMGYYERWFARGYNHRWGTDTGTVEQVDKYRAQELAYGHAGFIGAAQVDNVQWVAKEHHLMHAVQRLTGVAKVTDISYQVEGRLVPAGIALAMNERLRQRITYDNGLTLWVNWAAEPWVVRGRTLPQWGFLALGPDTEVYMALKGDKLADYAECPEYLFADARTRFNMPYLGAQVDIEPRLRDFDYLGDAKIRLTYEWIVDEPLDRDVISFVHFTNPQVGDQGIVFQQDHALPRPVREWKKGETIADGPYEVTVPADRFDDYAIVIGLYDKNGRVPLKGITGGGDAYTIGEIKLTREDGQITDIILGDLDEIAEKHAADRADFSANLNPPGTLVDFGKIATDGSVKVNRSAEALTVFPYPRGEPFSVSLDIEAIVPTARVDLARVEVRALAAGDQADLGVVRHSLQDGRVRFRTTVPAAGRYVVTW